MELKTVAAISTPRGKGGVALIRISGADALEIASKVFKSRVKPQEAKTHTVIYGTFFDRDGAFDDGLVTVFRAPRSFTGEDTAELCCHGGVLVTQKLLTAVFAAGAAPAGAGEFTKRAYINGKIALSKAEAVGAIIDAKSEKCLSVSAAHVRGTLSGKIDALIKKLSFLAASVYAYIDYPDEDLTDISAEEMKTRLAEIKAETDALAATHKYGKAISEGVQACIIGLPNTGKSSLLNALIGYERAIVTDIPGTTRDVVTEQLLLGSVILNIADTAGIRESDDIIEKIGVEKSREYMKASELILLVLDASKPLSAEDSVLIDEIYAFGKETETIVLLNKSDKHFEFDKSSVRLPNKIVFSARDKTGMSELAKAAERICGGLEASDEIIISARQHASLIKAGAALEAAINTLEAFSQDVACMDIETAIAALGELDGRSVNEEIVNEIFSHFCVGK